MQEFHTHTFRCKHAEGDISDLAEYAERRGYSMLGISDHTPFPDDHDLEIRMSMKELENYVQSFHTAKTGHPKLKMLLGMECEYFRKYRDFYKEELLLKRNFDYLILGQHIFFSGKRLVYFWKEGLGGTKKELWAYAEALVEGIESGIFSIVAHPDLFGNFYAPWDEEAKSCSRYILEAAQSYKIPLEINGNGYRKGKRDVRGIKRFLYPLEPFWEMASQYNISVLVNSDAHKPSQLAPVEEGWKLVDLYNLKVADLSELYRDSGNQD
ncbi:MAG TPA: histidinol-phosphatase [Anaerovoracaceae bacterium]|nr:histidinol-phosphatase [Anaerovoracaceae bacterium]